MAKVCIEKIHLFNIDGKEFRDFNQKKLIENAIIPIQNQMYSRKRLIILKLISKADFIKFVKASKLNSLGKLTKYSLISKNS